MLYYLCICTIGILFRNSDVTWTRKIRCNKSMHSKVLLFHKRHFHACVFSSLQLSAFLLPGYNWWWISTDRVTNWLTPVVVLSRVVESFVDRLHFGWSIVTIKSWKLKKIEFANKNFDIHTCREWLFLSMNWIILITVALGWKGVFKTLL